MRTLWRIIAACVAASFLTLGLLVTPAAHATTDAAGFSGSPGHPVHSTPATSNTLLDGDVQVWVTTSNVPRALNIAAEGWLHLTPKGAGYSGTFVDNLAGGKTFAARATGVSLSTDDGIYTLNTGNGPFVVTLSGGTTTISAPAKYGPIFAGSATAQPHSYTRNPAVTLSFDGVSVGLALPTVTGTLILTTDALGYIVPNAPKAGVVSTFTTITGTHRGVTPITAWGLYLPPTTVDQYFLGMIPVGKHKFFFESLPYYSSSSALGGSVFSQIGASFIHGLFTLQ